MTQQELIIECKIPYITLYTYCKEHGIRGRHEQVKGGEVVNYSDKDSEMIIEHFRFRREQKELEERLKKLPHDEYIKEMKKLHPLVTDEKCFENNYWPDPVPDMFKGDLYDES